MTYVFFLHNENNMCHLKNNIPEHLELDKPTAVLFLGEDYFICLFSASLSSL